MIKVSKNTIIIATVTVVAAGVGYIVYKNSKKTTKKSSKKTSSKKAVKSNEEDFSEVPEFKFDEDELEKELDEELTALEKKVDNGEEIGPSDLSCFNDDDDEEDDADKLDRELMEKDIEFLSQEPMRIKDPKINFEYKRTREIALRFLSRYMEISKLLEKTSVEHDLLLKNYEDCKAGMAEKSIQPELEGQFIDEDVMAMKASGIDAMEYDDEDEDIYYIPSVVVGYVDKIKRDFLGADDLRENLQVNSEEEYDECIEVLESFNSSLSMLCSAYLEQFIDGMIISLKLVDDYWEDVCKLPFASKDILHSSANTLAQITTTVSKNIKCIQDDIIDDTEDKDDDDDAKETGGNPLVDSLASRMAIENEDDDDDEE